MIAKHYGKAISRGNISDLAQLGLGGTSIKNLIEAAQRINFRALPVKVDYETLRYKAPLPCIALWQQRHYIVVYDMADKQVMVADPDAGLMKYKTENFLNGWLGSKDTQEEGVLLLLEPTPQFYEEELEGVRAKASAQKDQGIKFLFPYLRPYKKSFFRIFLGLLVITLIQLILPFLTQAVVDYGINYQNVNFVYLILIGQLVLFTSRTVAEIIRDWLLIYVGSKASVSLLSDFLQKLVNLPLQFFESRSQGDILQRINDHRRLEQFITQELFMMVFAVMNLLIFGVVIAIYSLWLFAIYGFGTILYILWILMFMKRREKIDHMRFDQLSSSQSSSIQIVEGITEIKLNNSQKRRRWEWEDIQVKFYLVEMKNLFLHHVQRTGGTFISEIKNIFITIS